MSKGSVYFDTTKLKVSVGLMRAIAHPLRLKILEYIDQNEQINVNKIYTALGLEQSITSQHLRILRKAGIVETAREGKFIYYQINYVRLNEARAALDRFFKNSRTQPLEG